jgi:hypothetical protein
VVGEVVDDGDAVDSARISRRRLTDWKVARRFGMAARRDSLMGGERGGGGGVEGVVLAGQGISKSAQVSPLRRTCQVVVVYLRLRLVDCQ